MHSLVDNSLLVNLNAAASNCDEDISVDKTKPMLIAKSTSVAVHAESFLSSFAEIVQQMSARAIMPIKHKSGDGGSIEPLFI